MDTCAFSDLPVAFYGLVEFGWPDDGWFWLLERPINPGCVVGSSVWLG